MQDTQQLGSLELPKITHASQISNLLQHPLQQNTSNDNKSNASTISIKKYLQVKSRNQDTLVEEKEEEEEEEDREEEDREEEDREENGGEMVSKAEKKPSLQSNTPQLSKPASEETTVQRVSREEDAKKRVESKNSRGKGGQLFLTENPLLTQEHSLALTRVQKEKLLANTAHALGVISRDWGKTPSVKKMLSGETNSVEMAGKKQQQQQQQKQQQKERQASAHRNRSSSDNLEGESLPRPHTKWRVDSARSYRRQVTTTPIPSTHRGHFKLDADSSNNNNNGGSSNNNNTRAATSHSKERPSGHKEREKDTEKIQKLKSIYKAASGSNGGGGGGGGGRNIGQSVNPSRQPSRCSNRFASRPATRLQNHTSHHHQQQQYYNHQIQKQQSEPPKSRPGTRMGFKSSRPATRLGSSQGGRRHLESLEESTYWSEVRKPQATKSGGNRSTTTSGTSNSTATVFGVVESPVQRAAAERTGEGKEGRVKGVKRLWTTGWKEDLAQVVSAATSKQHSSNEATLGRKAGVQATTVTTSAATADKVAQAIALAMKFQQPRKSLMKKLMGGEGNRLTSTARPQEAVLQRHEMLGQQP